MKEFVERASFREKEIIAKVFSTGQGVQVSLTGGDTPHIGAVGIVDPSGTTTIITFPTHKESVLCQSWCKAFVTAGMFPVVVSAGVHYDRVTQKDINCIVEICKNLLMRIIETLSKN